MADTKQSVLISFRREGGKLLDATRDTMQQLRLAATNLSAAVKGISTTSIDKLGASSSAAAKITAFLERDLGKLNKELGELKGTAGKSLDEYIADVKSAQYSTAQLQEEIKKAEKAAAKLRSKNTFKLDSAVSNEVTALNDQIQKALGQQAAYSDPAVARLQNRLEEIKAKTALIKKENLENNRALRNTNAQLNKVKATIQSTAGHLSSLAKIFAVILVGVAVGQLVTELRNASQAVAEIQTITDKTVESQQTLLGTATALAREYGTGVVDNARALYQIISAGVEAGADANLVLEESVKASIAGLTSVATAADGVTTILNAWRLPVSQTSEVFDALFATVKGGKTTLEELNKFIFQASSLTANLGVDYKELLASIIAITKQGTPARNAFTQIRQAEQGLIRDTPELNKLFLDAGFSSGKAALGVLGLKGTFDLLVDGTNGNVAQMQKLIGTVEGLQGVLQTTGAVGGKYFTEGLDSINNAAGATDEALKTVQENIDQEFRTTAQEFSTALIAVGEAVLPVIQDILGGVRSLTSGVREFATEYPGVFEAFTRVLLTVAGVIATAFSVSLIRKFAAFLSGPLINALSAYSAATTATAVSQATMAANAGLLATGIRRVAAALLFVLKRFPLVAAAALALSAAWQVLRPESTNLAATLRKTDKAIEEHRARLKEIKDSTEDTDRKVKDYSETVVGIRKELEKLATAQRNGTITDEQKKQYADLSELLENAKENMAALKKESSTDNGEAGAAVTSIVEQIEKLDSEIGGVVYSLDELKRKKSEALAADDIAASDDYTRQILYAEDQLQQLRIKRAAAVNELKNNELAYYKALSGAVKDQIKLEESLAQARSTQRTAALNIEEGEIRSSYARREISARDYYSALNRIDVTKLNDRVGTMKAHAEHIRQLLTVIPDDKAFLKERQDLSAELANIEGSIYRNFAERIDRSIRKARTLNDEERRLANERVYIERNADSIISGIKAKDQSAEQNRYELSKKLRETQADAEEARIKGNTDLAKRLYNEVYTLAQRYANTITGADGKSAASALDRAKAIRTVKAAEEGLLAINEEAAAKVKAQRDEEIALIEKLRGALADAASSFNDAIKVKVDDTEATRTLDNLAKTRTMLLQVDTDATRLQNAIEDALDKVFTIKVKPDVQGGSSATGYSTGGHVRGAGTSTSDSILAWLSDEEFVIKAAAVKKYGVGFFDSLNRMSLPGFADGGVVRQSAVQRAAVTGASSTTNRDVVDLNFNFGGKSYPLQGPRDAVSELMEALRIEQEMSV